MNVRLINNDRTVKECKIGFSWTLFVFGFFVPLFRKDFKYALIMFACGFLTEGLSWLVFPFFYNRWYINGLLKKGFYPATEADYYALVEKRFSVQPYESMKNENYNTYNDNIKEESINVEFKEKVEEEKIVAEKDFISEVDFSEVGKSEADENNTEKNSIED